jgi:outer membrane receptor for ferrienterochelin and colicin
MRGTSGFRPVFVAGVFIAAVLFGQDLFGQTNGQGEVFDLDKIIVSGTKTEHTLGDVPVEAQVITREEIQKKNIKTVQDALKLLPGVIIGENSGSWGNKGNISMQGLDASMTLILLNGQRYTGGHDSVDVQSIPIDMIERIEVVAGPASSLYGSDAMGGVVNIITRSSVEKNTFSGATSFGSDNTQIHEATAGFRRDSFSSLLSYTYRGSDGVEKETDRYREHLFQGSLRYAFGPDSTFTVLPYYSRHKMSYENRVQERRGASSIWEWSPDSLSKLNVRGSVLHYDHATGDKSSNWDTRSYEGEVSYTRLVAGNHLLTGGYQYSMDDIDDKGKDYTADQYLNSFYAQDEISLAPFVIVLGSRLDLHDRWGSEANPKASVLYNVTESLKIRGSVGTAFKGPPLVRLYGDGWRMGPYLVHANPDLEPEKSTGYQVGVEYSFTEGFLGKLSFFRNDIKDLISSRIVRNTPPPHDLYWYNVDEAMTRGVEASIAARLARNLSARAGYTYLDTEDKTLDRELTYRPRHKLSMELGYTIPDLGLHLDFSGAYTGQRYDDEYEKLGGYTLFNVALIKDITRNIQATVRVENILGKKNIPDEYDIDGTWFLAGMRVNL